MSQYEAARLFKALSEPPRLAILCMLDEHPGTLTVLDLENKMHEAGFTTAQETLSHHLKVLRRAGMVQYRQAGLHRYYSVCASPFATMTEIMHAFTVETAVVV